MPRFLLLPKVFCLWLALVSTLGATDSEAPDAPPEIPEIEPPPPPEENPPDAPAGLSDAFEGYDLIPSRIEWQLEQGRVILEFPMSAISGPTFLRYSSDLVTWKNLSVSYRTLYENGAARAREVNLDLNQLQTLGARYFRVRRESP
jgi:hypothetical protein